MAKPTRKPTEATAEIVELSEITTLEQLCVTCGVEEAWIGELIAHGAIAPPRKRGEVQHFAAVTVVRVKKAKRLERDFDLNVPGVALALDLIEEIEQLKARIRAFERPREPTD